MFLSPYFLPRSYRERLELYEKVERRSFSEDTESKLAALRMYAHIVDKGLSRRDWSPGHSSHAYREAKALTGEHLAYDDPTVEWSAEILAEYERRQNWGVAVSDRISLEVAPPPVKADDLLRQMQHRTSCRFYNAKPVEASAVEQITQAALEAPWSCSRQGLRVYAAVDPDAVSDILNCFMGFTSFGTAVPCAMVFCVDLRSYTMPAELFVPTLDAGLAAAYASLMASSLGLSMVFLSWGSRTSAHDARMRSLLEIPEHLEIVVGAACGYPSRVPTRPVRKPVSSALVWKP